MIGRVWFGVVLVLAVCVCYNASPLDPVKNLRVIDLNSWIKHYDIAHYDPNALQHQHRRRRSTEEYNGDIRITIRGHDRIFCLKLNPDSSTFAENFVIESTNGPLDFNPDITYSGTLEDDETATVHGIITKDGLFEGTISTATEEYHIEPLLRYLTNNTLDDQSYFHSVIYKASDVHNPSQSAPCASQLLHQKHDDIDTTIKSRQKRWLLQADAKLPYNDDNFWKQFKPASPALPPHDLNNPYNQQIDEELMQVKSSRIVADLTFRNVIKRAVDPKKTTCMLYLQADHQFFGRYRSEEACIEVMTRHVQRVNVIYRNTDFNQDGRPDNITFMIKRIKVHTTDALKDLYYRFPGNYGVEKYLELFSEEDYDAFCLAYMFTYRDFEMGTLGLAWTGDLKNAGGVCEKNGHYRGSMKSLNTGIVTLLNYGKHVPPAVSHVTLAHEIGHNFGSPHDPEQCTPGGEDGNFIMFARATSGDKRNNNRFSPCSLKSINPVLNFKARSAKGCFTEPQVSLCGNGVVEDGEECDCGWEEDCHDKCCFPQRKHPPPDERPCHLTPRSVCSPSQGPCCSSECELKFGDKCRDDNGCRDASFCNGRSAHCPPSVNKPNKTICNKEFVCFMGECTGSICLAYGLESCQCIPKNDDAKTKACELCCKLPGDNQPCMSSFEWNEIPYDVPDMFSKPGTPCNDYSGYCDVFQVCREVDPSGPLATLRKLLLSDESIASFRRWLMEYWYTVALVISGVVILLILCNKFLGKQHSQKLKTVTIMHGTTTEAVRLPPDCDNGQVTVHPAIRSKVPLKRKVRHGRSKKRKETHPNQKPTKGSKPASKNKKKVVTKPTSNGEKAPDTTKNAKNAARVAKPSNKNKKVINYTAPLETDGKKELLTGDVVHGVTTPDTDPFGKVQNWLLKSQNCLPKSKSTPEGLKEKAQKSPQKRAVIKLRNDKSHSVGNLASEKMRLQIVYKPPFKFSVKLRKPDKSCGVQVAGKKVERKTPRTAVLIKTVSENKTKKTVKPVVANQPVAATVAADDIPDNSIDAIDANTHTVQSDLEVLLSDNEFSCTNK